MLSQQQVRGRLRSRFVSALKAYDVGKSFRDMLRDNDQRVSGSLEGSILRSYMDFSISVSFEGDVLDYVTVSVDIPWGNYGVELDEEGGAGAVTDTVYPEFIAQWIRRKGISTSLTVRRQLKGGFSREYTYNNTQSSINAMAYFITRNIEDEGEVRTRYDYSGQLKAEIEDVLYTEIEEFIEEYTMEFYGDLQVEIDNLF